MVQKNYYKNKFSKSLAKKKIKIKSFFYKKNWLAHHGLERSGTNFLRACLIELKINLINQFDPPENNPTHKHFRWYNDKSLIPKFRKQFHNKYVVNNIFDINKICNFPSETKHIIIKKKIGPAITSIANYLYNERLLNNKDEVKINISTIYKDYQAYYNFWHKISERNPYHVQLLFYEDLILSSKYLIDNLKKIGIETIKNVPTFFHFDELHQSNKNRNKVFTEKEVLDILDDQNYYKI